MQDHRPTKRNKIKSTQSTMSTPFIMSTSPLRSSLPLSLALAAATVLAACARLPEPRAPEVDLTQAPPAPKDERAFVVDIERPPTPPYRILNGVLEVRRFRVSARYADPEFVYRFGENDFKIDDRNRFLIEPSKMLAEESRNWFDRSGLFAGVVDSASHVEANWILEGHVLSLYADYRKYQRPSAIMEVQFSLIFDELTGSEIVYQRQFRHQAELPDDTPEALSEGYNECLRQVLASLEVDLLAAAAGI